jgi:hypothetical protein
MVEHDEEMFMRALIFAAALALMTAPALAQTTAPAPAPDGAIAVSVDQNGQSIEAAAGAQIAIQLQRNGSAGANWSVTSRPEFLGSPSELSGPTVTSSRPVLGAPSWQVFVFPVNDSGTGEVTLEKRDRTGATIETFTVTINATAQ